MVKRYIEARSDRVESPQGLGAKGFDFIQSCRPKGNSEAIHRTACADCCSCLRLWYDNLYIMEGIEGCS